MKQVLQHLDSGVSEVAEVPAPQEVAGHVLIQTSRSLVSAGTERMLVEFGKANLVDDTVVTTQPHNTDSAKQHLECSLSL